MMDDQDEIKLFRLLHRWHEEIPDSYRSEKQLADALLLMIRDRLRIKRTTAGTYRINILGSNVLVARAWQCTNCHISWYDYGPECPRCKTLCSPEPLPANATASSPKLGHPPAEPAG